MEALGLPLFLLPSLRRNNPCGVWSLVPFTGEWYLGTKTWVRCELTALLQGCQWTELVDTGIYTDTCIYSNLWAQMLNWSLH